MCRVPKTNAAAGYHGVASGNGRKMYRFSIAERKQYILRSWVCKRRKMFIIFKITKRILRSGFVREKPKTRNILLLLPQRYRTLWLYRNICGIGQSFAYKVFEPWSWANRNPLQTIESCDLCIRFFFYVCVVSCFVWPFCSLSRTLTAQDSGGKAIAGKHWTQIVWHMFCLFLTVIIICPVAFPSNGAAEQRHKRHGRQNKLLVPIRRYLHWLFSVPCLLG